MDRTTKPIEGGPAGWRLQREARQAAHDSIYLVMAHDWEDDDVIAAFAVEADAERYAQHFDAGVRETTFAEPTATVESIPFYGAGRTPPMSP